MNERIQLCKERPSALGRYEWTCLMLLKNVIGVVHISNCDFSTICLAVPFTYKHKHTHAHTHTRARIPTHTYIHTHTHTETYIHAHTRTYKHIRAHTSTHTTHTLTNTTYTHTHKRVHFYNVPLVLVIRALKLWPFISCIYTNNLVLNACPRSMLVVLVWNPKYQNAQCHGYIHVAEHTQTHHILFLLHDLFTYAPAGRSVRGMGTY